MLSLEVVSIPVSNVERAISFYRDHLGFHLDVDYHPVASFRVVQLTPPGSACSIHLGERDAGASVKGLYLVTNDIEASRAELIRRGVAVSDVRRKEPLATWQGEWATGVDAQRRDYASFADFSDPDGNVWTLQERGYRER